MCFDATHPITREKPRLQAASGDAAAAAGDGHSRPKPPAPLPCRKVSRRRLAVAAWRLNARPALGRLQFHPVCREIQIVYLIAADPLKECPFWPWIIFECAERQVVLCLSGHRLPDA